LCAPVSLTSTCSGATSCSDSARSVSSLTSNSSSCSSNGLRGILRKPRTSAKQSLPPPGFDHPANFSAPVGNYFGWDSMWNYPYGPPVGDWDYSYASYAMVQQNMGVPVDNHRVRRGSRRSRAGGRTVSLNVIGFPKSKSAEAKAT
jgi:hypothetical protein